MPLEPRRAGALGFLGLAGGIKGIDMRIVPVGIGVEAIQPETVVGPLDCKQIALKASWNWSSVLRSHGMIGALRLG
ncbi:hypothetical protein ELH44_36940 [Rhizobium ruizarguesonis]|uniref:hypothetical protein n=1 Tax=Rhizobium ruizarguesonis TaxID=2081791 RepID=UPI00103249B6|nr:hypothetical protein [Rhizobium ruizarguesonis]TBB38553.1 hypothetical protein ELH44_36940 [Rhizobium ruizarguesonis]